VSNHFKTNWIKELVKSIPRVTRSDVPPTLGRIQGKRSIVGVVGVWGRKMQRPVRFQKTPKGPANARVVIQVLQNLCADDFIKALILEIKVVDVPVLKSKPVRWNTQVIIEQGSATVHLRSFDANAYDIISSKVALVTQHSVATSSVKHLTWSIALELDKMGWDSFVSEAGVQVDSREDQPLESGLQADLCQVPVPWRCWRQIAISSHPSNTDGV